MKNRKIGKRFMALTLSMVMMISAPVAYAKEGLGTEEPGIEVHAESKAADENGFEIKDGVLTKYKGNAAEVVIPDSVTSIGNYAFYQCTSLKSVTIPDSVTSIEDFAFNSCTSLESITIPDSVTSIGNYAFSSCSSLKNITIPDSVTSIGRRAFSGCSSLDSILVEPGNSVYDSRNNCNAIINTKINEMIAGCKNTVIPDSVASIGEGVFSSSSFESIIIPDGVTSSWSYTF